MKKIILLLTIGLSLLSFYGCKDTTVTEAYAIGIFEFNGDGNVLADYAAVTVYLQGKGILVESKVIEASSTAKANEEAIALWEKNVAMINETELAALVKGAFTFKYCLIRGSADSSVQNPCLKEKEFKFNQ